MTKTLTGAPVHPAAETYVRDYEAGKLDRREFLARTTALGVTAAGAYGMIGLAQPAQAAEHMQQGGTLRMQMEVRALKDPRTFDWTQMAYVVSGWLEYLVEYNNDGSFQPMLLESWEVNDDATQYTLNVRQGVTWNDGTPFTAEDVAFNITRWCERDVEGNSMATRFAVIIDDETGEAMDGAIEVVDEHTVRLNLPAPDITLIAGMADYPAPIVPQDFSADQLLENQKGTGPYLNTGHEVGVRSTLVRNEGHEWWGYAAGKGAALDTIEFIDYGTDPVSWLAAAEAGEVDVLYETVGEFIDIFDSIGWQKSEVVSGATIVIRPNQLAEVNGMRPYEDVRVRQAIVKAVDNSVCLQLGYASRGVEANNHHVAPIHPEYAEVPRLEYDPEAAYALLEEAGMTDFEFELISIDDDWRRNTTDAVAAQLRDAGFNVTRTVLPGSTFWNDWTNYPFSSTNWNHRPLGTQILGLAYRTGEAWNEFGFSNEEFDSLLAEANSIADADARREVMARLEQILVDEGVTIQPYWRSLYRHAREGVVGADQHIAYLPQLYKLGLAA
ncbi:ABC transporter substrate-binding protein [Histidinibacterium aquaticum]|uniref:ABC transporter substrate-binding protein n=1 Tax=Histidinibacterium aquaticum TaxID=2613962 RepID=A0A5J5GM47_9RHOB|nr:ABC transporter substrate-binding protein [Histidinibacterium aquaticum]KAA9008723.1 ABC transporter substrate-binding protein [Histidinibacterium aquaticum]